MNPKTTNLYRQYYVLLCINVFLFISVPFVNAQKAEKTFSKAKLLYQEEKFEKASKQYLKIVKSETYYEEAYVQLARCYQHLEEYENADHYFSQIFGKSTNVDPAYFLEYGQLLMLIGRNDEARSYFTSYNNLVEINDLRVSRYIKSIEDINKYYLDSTFIRLNKLPVSSEGEDQNPLIFNQSLIFETNKDFIKSAPTNSSLYIQSLNELSSKIANEISGAAAQKNTSFGFAIAASTGELYRSVKDEKLSPGQIVLVRSFVEDNGQQLSKGEQVIPEGWYDNIAYPTLDNTGNTLIFSSDSKKGNGGWDLFICRRGTYGYSEPLSLPGFINTPGNEKFPYLANDSILFFASDGHGGLGGYDLFYVNLNVVSAMPKNLGYPVNSQYNEYGLCLNTDQSAGFLASDRASAKTFADLYSFSIDQVRAIGVVTDKTTGENLKNVAVEITGVEEEAAHLILADNGRFNIVGLPGDVYNLSVWREGYTLESYSVSNSQGKTLGLYEVDIGTFPIEPSDIQVSPPLPEPDPVTIAEDPIEPESEPATIEEESIEPEPESETQPITTPGHETVFRLQIAASRSPLSDSEIRNKYKGDKDVFMFEEEEWFKYAIGEYASYFEANNERKLCGVKDAFIAAYKQGSKKIALNMAINEVHTQPARKISQPYTEPANRDILQNSTVYFPFDLYEPDQHEMVKLVALAEELKNDGSLFVEINGHSDIQGSSDYNFGLSQARAEFIKKYMVEQGIGPERITVISYGERKVEQYCDTNCTPAIHKANRRAEVILFRQ